MPNRVKVLGSPAVPSRSLVLSRAAAQVAASGELNWLLKFEAAVQQMQNAKGYTEPVSHVRSHSLHEAS